MATAAVSDTPRMRIVKPKRFMRDKRLDGWTLIEEGPNVDYVEFDIEFVSVKEPRVIDIQSFAYEMEGCANGQHLAERIFAVAEDIPMECREHWIFFPATVWLASPGHLYVPTLFWTPEECSLDFLYLGEELIGDSLLVRLCNK